MVTGHSLGSALATRFVMENDANKKFDVTTCCTFASPRVGNKQFVTSFNRLPMASWRIVNSWDLVPRLPLRIPFLFDYRHVLAAYRFSSWSTVRCSVVCWHDLGTHLHWLDPSSGVAAECRP